ncbi:hypothetical protein LCGC14_2103390 [marine sediment metagenome]|uniref:Uncharacterized protein n=1 Tax=marine sediment metagenome TaxID=412755 RepID=A0A0F9E9D4_9ZZZZ
MADNDIQKMVDGWEDRLRNANAENARLLEQMEEANEVMKLAIVALKERVQEVDLLKRERDDYKALAERRKKALEWYGNRAESLIDFIKKPDSYLLAIYTELSLDGGKRARAAIEEEEK